MRFYNLYSIAIYPWELFRANYVVENDTSIKTNFIFVIKARLVKTYTNI